MLFSSILSKQAKKNLKFLLQTQYWSLRDIKDLQYARLHALLKHCYNTVPFYHERFSFSGLTPDECLRGDNFKKFPVLTKKDIQENQHNLISTVVNNKELLPNATGGSTGAPLNFFQDKNYWEWEKAAAIRAWKYFPGFSTDELEAIFWGAERDIGKGLSIWRVMRSVIRERVLPLNTFDVDSNLISKFFQYYRILRPKIIRGYASSLFFIANYLNSEKISFALPHAIISSAETLLPTMRRVVEDVFGAPVFDSYGCREVSQIATECSSHQGLHIVMENQFVEIVDGQIIVTNLTNFGMPFIRYKIGDCADYIDESPCRCGRALPRLLGLRGRESETIALPNGKMVHGEYFTHLFYGEMGISHFTAHYHSRSCKLEIICSSLTHEMQEKIKKRIAADFGLLSVQFKQGDQDKASSGKFRFVKATND